MEILTYLADIGQNIGRVIMSITVFDVIDIILMTAIVFMVITFMRETRAEQLLKGIGILVLLFFAAQIFQLKAMSFLMENFFQVGIVAIVIVFQPEVRRILEKVGGNKVVSSLTIPFEQGDVGSDKVREAAIESIAEACDHLHKSCTGALIVIERQTKLGEIVEKATVINGELSSNLLRNLFYNKSPLHDGAVVIRDNRIWAAGCFLPNTNKDQYLSSDLGSRHRAALGMSENSDAIVVVVSEETGTISVAENGQLTRSLTRESLIKYLQKKLPEAAGKAKKKGKRVKAKPDGDSAVK